MEFNVIGESISISSVNILKRWWMPDVYRSGGINCGSREKHLPSTLLSVIGYF